MFAWHFDFIQTSIVYNYGKQNCVSFASIILIFWKMAFAQNDNYKNIANPTHIKCACACSYMENSLYIADTITTMQCAILDY